MSATEKIEAIILANGGACALAERYGVPHKALLEVGGRPLVERVLAAVEACPDIGRVVVACQAGGPVAEYLAGRVPLAETEDPSFLGGLQQAFRQIAGERALVVACDLPFLTAEAVSYLAQEAARWPEADVIYGMVDRRLVQQRFPQVQCTAVRLQEGTFTAAGLSVLSRRLVEECGPRLREAFGARKNIFALARLLGLGFVWRFVLGRLSLAQVVKRGEELLGGQCQAVALPYPECACDIDDEEDWQVARQLADATAARA